MGSTIRKHYAIGYKAAMTDLVDALEVGGIENLLEWIANNAHPLDRQRLDAYYDSRARLAEMGL